MAVRPIDAMELKQRMCDLCNQDYSDEPCEPSDCVFVRAIDEAPTLTPPNEPLTLEQLLEMNGKPVWTKLLVESTGRKEGWTLVYNDDGHAAVQRWTQFPLWYKDYGKTWLAYAYHPVHIDHEKWEPCYSCNSKCLICMINETHKCRVCKDYKYYLPLYQFCPKCGRPITDEAWDELEKRMRGM